MSVKKAISPFYCWDLKSFIDPTLFSDKYVCIGQLIIDSKVVGYRFKPENSDDLIDVPLEAFEDEIDFCSSIAIKHNMPFWPIVSLRDYPIADFTSIRLHGASGKVCNYEIDENWNMNDDKYISIQYPHMVYRIRKTKTLNERYFAFLNEVTKLLYDTTFVDSMCLYSLNMFDFYTNFPKLTIEGSSMLHEMGFSEKECVQIFHNWCDENNVDNKKIKVFFNETYMKIEFDYDDIKSPFGKFKTSSTKDIAIWSRNMRPLKKHGNEVRWWRLDDNFIFWLLNADNIPEGVYPKTAYRIDYPLAGTDDMLQELINENLEGGFVGYRLNGDKKLTCVTGFKDCPEYQTLHDVIQKFIKNIVRKSDYLQEIEVEDKFTVSFSFSSIGQRTYSFTYKTEVDFSVLGSPIDVLEYLDDEISNQISYQYIGGKILGIDVGMEPIPDKSIVSLTLLIQEDKDRTVGGLLGK